MKSGTFQDKISAISLYIRKEPKFTLKYLDILVKIVYFLYNLSVRRRIEDSLKHLS